MRVTFITGIFTVRSYMTNLAFLLTFFPMINRELVIYQQRWMPADRAVAVLALIAEESSVDLRLWMAILTFGRRVLKTLVNMAVQALDFGMAAVKYKEFLVIKILHTINSIMAFKAICSKLRLVLGHELQVALGVAIKA